MHRITNSKQNFDWITEQHTTLKYLKTPLALHRRCALLCLASLIELPSLHKLQLPYPAPTLTKMLMVVPAACLQLAVASWQWLWDLSRDVAFKRAEFLATKAASSPGSSTVLVTDIPGLEWGTPINRVGGGAADRAAAAGCVRAGSKPPCMPV